MPLEWALIHLRFAHSIRWYSIYRPGWKTEWALRKRSDKCSSAERGIEPGTLRLEGKDINCANDALVYYSEEGLMFETSALSFPYGNDTTFQPRDD